MSDVVLGGAGFIGSHLSDALGCPHLVLDNFSNGKLENISRWAEWWNVDASLMGNADLAKCVKDARVFNLAVKSLPYSLENPLACFHDNVAIAENLAELMRKDVFPELIHFSSSEVYGEGTDLDADSPLNKPRTTYAASKTACDALLLSYAHLYGLNIRIVRPFNCYGERQNEGTYAGVIPNTIKRIKAGLHPFITGDGEQTRDFNYVGDVVREALKPSKERVKVIGSGNPAEIEFIVGMVCEAMGYKGEIDRVPARQGDVRELIAKPTYQPSISLYEGIKRTVEWYAKQT